MEFATRFDPKEAEPRIYQMWEKGGGFTADSASPKEPFTIVIPPPNVTGSLHLGHALNNTLQDILIRWKRMDGCEVLYLPGTDHAGIATQSVVERELRKKEGKTRWDLGREEFLKRVWAWKEEYGNRILYQLRRLGCSCDWSRTRFTMDEGYSRAVRTVFVALFKKGHIYRGHYVINWCPACRTALSDLEVERREQTGKLWTFRYPLKGGGTISVSTTRPETVLGDTAIAVHPKDERYRALVGRTALVPVLDRAIPVVADEYVDPAFGTGAVKITPAHDVNDFEVARRHKLPAVEVMDAAGKMNQNAGPFAGQDRFECRKAIIAELEKRGLFEGEKDYPLVLGKCARCSTVIEPRLSEQWFVRMAALAQPAVDEVKRQEVRFFPERWSKIYFDWMESIRDWCISRQLWWGHRIPVWYCACGIATASVEPAERCTSCGGRELRQDEDVLDTWFSSALWPFATLGWPEETDDLEKFYPSQVLVTGRDIINLWVARMIVSGLEFRGEKPFTDVVINATILDDEGMRQSKSKGTGVDPLQLIDEYGADALRFALAWLSTGTQDIRFGDKLSTQRVEMSRNFTTKLWNAARYVEQKRKETPPGKPGNEIEDRWIRSRCHATVARVEEALGRYDFAEMAQTLYSFVWDDFCDWYIELSKRRASEPAAVATLLEVLETILRLLHPVMPFVTEEIWQKLERPGRLITAEWPAGGKRDEALETRMELCFAVVRGVREVRNRNRIAPKQALNIVISCREEGTARLLEEGREILRSQANLDGLKVGVALAKPKGSLTIAHEKFSAYLPLDAKDREAEVVRTRAEREKVKTDLEQKRGQLANPKFVEAKPELAARLREQVEALESKEREIDTHLRELEEGA